MKILASGPINSRQTDGETMETVTDFIFLGSKSLQKDGLMKLLTQWTWVWASSGRCWRTGKPGVLQFMGLQRVGYDWVSEQQMLVWSSKNWCFWIVVLEKTLKSPLDSKEVKPVNPKENQPWVFIARTDAEAEFPILCPLMEKPTHWKRRWCCERLKAEREGDNRGWDGWMASLTQWTWV